MPNYNEAQGVADLLSKFDFNIISEGPGDFSTQHRKYTCEFSKPGIESFTTTYQSNPRFGGHPTATDVFAALATESQITPATSETLSAKSPTPRLTSTLTTCSSGFPITTSGLRRRISKAFSKAARATSSR